MNVYHDVAKIKAAPGTLAVWHKPHRDEQIEVEGTFYVTVRSPEQALEVLEILQEYDIFQFHNKVKLEYTGCSGLMIFLEDQWREWYSDAGYDIHEWYPGVESKGN
jgi:hypothetical protein